MTDGTATVICDARVFDGERVAQRLSVLLRDGVIAQLGEADAFETSEDAVAVVDAAGGTLLPGLIDSHTHVFGGSLEQALLFGVTTELDMFADPGVVSELKVAAAARDDLADLRSAGTCATAPGGHPTGLVARGFYPPFPTIEDPAEAESFVTARISEGSDYLKIIIDDGAALGYSRPTLSTDTVQALIRAAHRHGLLAIVHALDPAAAQLAIEAGADGLAHLAVTNPAGLDLAGTAAQRAPFVIPTLVALAAISGHGHGPEQAGDPRFAAYLDQTSHMMLTMAGGNFPLGAGADVDADAPAAVLQQLRHAGVPILAGTDAGTLGVAHGASLHRELQLLVDAGLTPIEALSAATAAPADRFGLHDRGRIRPGLAADLLLVDGDPTTDITTTANIRAIWRRGTRLNRQPIARSRER